MRIEEKLKVNAWIINEENHIQIKKEFCMKCKKRICIKICPGKCFYEIDSEIMHSHDSCLECGACRIVCPFNAIIWNYPKGGYGVWYRFG